MHPVLAASLTLLLAAAPALAQTPTASSAAPTQTAGAPADLRARLGTEESLACGLDRLSEAQVRQHSRAVERLRRQAVDAALEGSPGWEPGDEGRPVSVSVASWREHIEEADKARPVRSGARALA